MSSDEQMGEWLAQVLTSADDARTALDDAYQHLVNLKPRIPSTRGAAGSRTCFGARNRLAPPRPSTQCGAAGVGT